MRDEGAAAVPLLTVGDAARLLKTTAATIRRRAQAGQLPAVPSARGTMRFALADVLAQANRDRGANVAAERHVCLFMREPERLAGALRGLLGPSLAAGGLVALALDRAETRLSALLAEPGLQDAVAEGRLRVVEAAAPLKEGHFDAAATLEWLACLAAEFDPAGSPIVLVNEIGGGRSAPSGAEIARYEAGVNHLVSERRAEAALSVVCLYDASRLNGEAIVTALEAHPSACIDGIRRVGLTFGGGG